MLQKLLACFRSEGPQSLFVLARKRSAATSKLYVIHTDFPIDRDKANALDAQLEPLRKKFGLDFLVLEPGIKLTRFDDIDN